MSAWDSVVASVSAVVSATALARWAPEWDYDRLPDLELHQRLLVRFARPPDRALRWSPSAPEQSLAR